MPGKPVWSGSRKKPHVPTGAGPLPPLLACGHEAFGDPAWGHGPTARWVCAVCRTVQPRVKRKAAA